ncbi:hypothetical protein F441_01625, partial [Phytophthora nicotianae CJ01A1]
GSAFPKPDLPCVTGMPGITGAVPEPGTVYA